jgi:hypothetical protein
VYAARLITIVAFTFTASVQAQAWLPAEHAAGIQLTTSSNLSTKHYDKDGVEADVGHTQVYALTMGGFYSFTDRLMLDASLPIISSRYDGDFPHRMDGQIVGVDDGDYHTTATDLGANLHFQALLNPVAIAPYVGLVVPTHDYATMGHAAPGRGLNELSLGFYIAKSLDQWIPNTYVQARYNYAFVEHVAGISHDRVNTDFELGWFPTPRFAVHAIYAIQDTHGGIDLPIAPSDPLFIHHDQLGAQDYDNLGGALSFLVTRASSIYLLYNYSLEGVNGHKLDRGINIGWSYDFHEHQHRD